MELVLQAAAIVATFATLWFLSAVCCLDELTWVDAPTHARPQAEPE